MVEGREEERGRWQRGESRGEGGRRRERERGGVSTEEEGVERRGRERKEVHCTCRGKENTHLLPNTSFRLLQLHTH